MTQFDYLLKKRKKHLALFSEALKGLEGVKQSLQQERSKAQADILQAQSHMLKRGEAIAFLDDEMKKTETLAARIAAILE